MAFQVAETVRPIVLGMFSQIAAAQQFANHRR
jgi:hypothetical protein